MSLVRSLRGNSLGVEGWCAIFAALRDNQDNKIEVWDLQREGIGPEIAKVLGEYISVSTAIRSLKCVTGARSNPKGSNPKASAAIDSPAPFSFVGSTTMTSVPRAQSTCPRRSRRTPP